MGKQFVFDGYEGTSTKDMTHQRRAKGQAGITVTFTGDMQFTMKKDKFLANKSNKQHFINLLSIEEQVQGASCSRGC